ncbi:hypothetical protein [Promicromonospora xylanilytica]
MRFDEPLDGWFTYVTWDIDLRLAGAVVRASARRDDHRGQLIGLAREFAGERGVRTAHALEVTFIPPIAGGPRYDLAVLVHGGSALGDEVTQRAAARGLPAPELVLTGRNSGRIGDTEARDGEVLLNHFAGSVTPQRAVEAWRAVAPWYAETLGVDNSTLLETEPDAPFLIVNYAVIPGGVVPFLAGQMLRPSFHRVVRRRLRDAGITPYPVFTRRIGE